MRKFYEVLIDSGKGSLAFIDDYELEGFDNLSLIRAEKCDNAAFAKTKVYIEDTGRPLPDYMEGPLSWPIFSSKFYTLIADLVRDDAEVLSPNLFSLSSKSAISGYRLLNLMKIIDCVDMKKSVIGPGANNDNIIYDLKVDETKVPETAHIFRPVNGFGRIVISEEFLAKIRGCGLTGIALTEV
ncbi:imm11 family protein [Endozoicomonas acroporae]|uniref:imm11 family protein n=1 Tax=Endozoicomonas acroporae TaxID=1701104 RepID=UPI003D7BB38D